MFFYKRKTSIFLALHFLCALAVYAQTCGTKQKIEVLGVEFNMIYIEPGTFTMGAISDEDYDKREHPSHIVEITQGYYIGETEVTQELWEVVMGYNPSKNIGKNKPVENVDWNDCQTFVSILTDITGKKFKLPSEAEWEYAAKGGKLSNGYIFSGSNNLDDVAWYIVNSGDKQLENKVYILGLDENNNQTHEVKTKKPNEIGLYDMSGNVSEWCEDGFCEYSAERQYDPKGISSNKNKVKRGGGL